jgi:aminoglycoside phosphotransferase (APT) family kinase protein
MTAKSTSEPAEESAAAAWSALPAELLDWVETSTGGRLTGTRRLPGGNRREAWAVDLVVHADAKALFLRYDPSDPAVSGDPFTIAREAAFYAALQKTGVAIPCLWGVHPRRQAMLTERVAGRSDYSRIKDAKEKRDVSLDFMRRLGQLHAIDAASVAENLPQKTRSIPALIGEEIALWEGLYRQTRQPDPLIEFGLRWLTGKVPNVAERASIVHGDAGPGNFLFEAGRVAALLDWELAHLGDPLEDIAWLSMRTVLEPFPDFAACLREYERATGRRIDLARVRFHRVLVQWRIAIIRHRNQGEDVANSLISRAVNRRLLVEAIAEAAGSPAPRYQPVPAPATPREAYFDASLAYLRDAVTPAIADPFALAKVKSVARIVKFLKEQDRLGDAMARAEAGDLGEALGAPAGAIAEARERLAARIRDGRADDSATFAYLARQAGRDTQVMSTALGALAWRPFPPLEDETP